MITVGIVKELHFIGKVYGADSMTATIQLPGKPNLVLKVIGSILEVSYSDNLIWRESIEGDASFFGIESCDAISRIIACIDNGSPWDQYRHVEST